MQVSEILDTTFKLIDKVDSIWNFFYMANGGVIAFIIINGSFINLWYKIVFSTAYILFLIAQLISHLRAYSFLNVAVNELKATIEFQDNCFVAKETTESLNRLKYQHGFMYCSVAYLLLFLGVMVIIWFL